MPSGQQLDGGRELTQLTLKDSLTGNLVSRIIDALNRTASNAAVSSQGELPAPSPVDSISVKGTFSGNTLIAPGEILHAVHTHNVPIQRGIQYITEIDTDPSFSNPHPIDTGASRSVFAHIPARDDNGVLVNYYLRVTPQLHGSSPARPTVYGGLQGPTPIQFTGATSMTLLTSQAAGTAKPGQGGQGLGAVAARGPVGGPKRQLTQS